MKRAPKKSMAEASRATSMDCTLAERLAHIDPILLGCHRRMGSPLSAQDLEEVRQDACLSAWRQRHRFRGDADVDSWIYGIVRFRILDRIRFLRRDRPDTSDGTSGSEVVADPRVGPSVEADTGIARVVNQNLAALGTTLITVYRARILDGQSFVTISSSLNLNEAAVKARFYRSLPEMRRRLRSIWH